MITFTIFGIPVRVEPWFWLTMAFIGGALRATDALSMLLVLIFMAAGFISILVHELGHALMIRKYGLPTAISLIAFGGFASYPAGVLSRKQSFLVTAAGPGVQLLLGLGALLMLNLLPIPPASLLFDFVQYIVLVSIIWAILNCLPVYPMDGGQMLAAVLGPERQPFVYLIGAVVAVLIGLLAYLFLYQSWLLIIFMGFFAWKNWSDFMQSRSGSK